MIFREINERIEAGAKMHGIEAVEQIHCECDRSGCFEMLDVRPAAYRKVLAERYLFVTAPGHADSRVERIIEEEKDYCVVEKVGEAREALDAQHPQEQHSTE